MIKKKNEKIKDQTKQVHFDENSLQTFIDKKVSSDQKTKPNPDKKSKKLIIKSDITNDLKKKWNQTEAPDGTKFKQGKFTPEEVDALKHSICQFVTDNNMGIDGLRKMVTEDGTTAERMGAWSKISEALPLRPVKSCHNLAKRLFNPLNYKGHWTTDEEQQLLRLIDLHGRKWKTIAEELDRTPINVRDKFKSMGEESHDLRQKDHWTIKELIMLIRLIEKRVNAELLDADINEESLIKKLEEKDDVIFIDVSRKRKHAKFDKNMKIIGKFINYEVARKTDFRNINWTKIAKKIQTKSKDDCRNKWYNQILNTFYSENEFTDEQDSDLINQIYDQGVESDSEIDWSQIKNSKNPQENKFRFQILKKRISARGFVSSSEVLEKLAILYKDKKKKEKLKIPPNSLEKKVPENPLFNLFKKEYQN